MKSIAEIVQKLINMSRIKLKSCICQKLPKWWLAEKFWNRLPKIYRTKVVITSSTQNRFWRFKKKNSTSVNSSDHASMFFSMIISPENWFGFSNYTTYFILKASFSANSLPDLKQLSPSLRSPHLLCQYWQLQLLLERKLRRVPSRLNLDYDFFLNWFSGNHIELKRRSKHSTPRPSSFSIWPSKNPG